MTLFLTGFNSFPETSQLVLGMVTDDSHLCVQGKAVEDTIVNDLRCEQMVGTAVRRVLMENKPAVVRRVQMEDKLAAVENKLAAVGRVQMEDKLTVVDSDYVDAISVVSHGMVIVDGICSMGFAALGCCGIWECGVGCAVSAAWGWGCP